MSIPENNAYFFITSHPVQTKRRGRSEHHAAFGGGQHYTKQKQNRQLWHNPSGQALRSASAARADALRYTAPKSQNWAFYESVRC
ncbi:hypothetical protein ULF88_04280 [Halopseudomonas pachastrellae]|nr:hypothetical protein [Halopseudomonas pachastrellae]